MFINCDNIIYKFVKYFRKPLYRATYKLHYTLEDIAHLEYSTVLSILLMKNPIWIVDTQQKKLFEINLFYSKIDCLE